MILNNNSRGYSSYILTVIIIFSTVLLSYSNTFNASWHFDDYDNIPNNQALQITNLEPSTLFNTFFANPFSSDKKNIYRPISNLTFALNWYVGGEEVWGYHLVNILIHCIAALFLFLSILQLYGTSSLANTDKNLTHTIALFATLLWALNPIQTQAITYIVQRMASLAAMFSIIAIYSYLRARQAISCKSKLIFYCCTLLWALLAIGSKENAAILPVLFILIEIIFFQKIFHLNKYQKIFFISLGILFSLVASFLFLNGEPLSFIRGYDFRSFTLAERLLTEPRIITTYLTQLFFPAPFRLSLEHDVILSTSFITPWTTLPAFAFISILLFLGITCIKKYPIISISILFFFLSHIVESSVIPLELSFEHRNYLPSMFLFLPIADYIAKKIKYYKESNPTVSGALKYIFLSLLLTLGFGTYLRNLTWISEESLWQDTIRKAPFSARAAFNLGKVYLKAGQFDNALILFDRAERLADTAPTPKSLRTWALNGIGSVYLLTDDPVRALIFFEKSLSVDPLFGSAHYNSVLAYFAQNKWSEANNHLQILFNKDKNNIDYIYMKNIISINTQSPIQEEDFNKFPEAAPKNINLMITTANSYKKINKYRESEIFLKKYNDIAKDDILVKLALVEIYQLQNDVKKIIQLKNEITSKFTQKEIEEALSFNSNMLNPYFSTQELIATMFNNN